MNEWLKLHLAAGAAIDDVYDVVLEIVKQFSFLVEDKGLWKELWHDGKRRPEKSAQRLFFAVAHSYCDANNLDINPEMDTGTGVVDFKFSIGSKAKVIVEIKLSDNPKVVAGYEKQLETYKKSEPPHPSPLKKQLSNRLSKQASAYPAPARGVPAGIGSKAAQSGETRGEGVNGRWRAYDYDELMSRDKASLDIFWLKDESLEDSDNLPAPGSSHWKLSRTCKPRLSSSRKSWTILVLRQKP